MTPERFQQIVEAYGADPRRWPREERAAAQAWAARHRPEADALLADAAGIDAWLAADKVDAPGAALQQRILAGAPEGGPPHCPKGGCGGPVRRWRVSVCSAAWRARLPCRSLS